MHIAFGTDTYGAVRSVARTPIVTKFWMLQLFPVYPLESYYLLRLGRKSHSGVPLLAGEQRQEIVGLPCRQVSALSVLTAYVRAIAAALVLPSMIALFFFGVGSLTDATFQFNAEKKNMLTYALYALAGGVALGLLTYLFTWWTPSRERSIRLACGRVLGIAADPGYVKTEYASQIAEQIRGPLQQYSPAGLDALLRNPRESDLPALDLWLVHTRTQMLDDQQASLHEATTDRILEAIDVVLDLMKGRDGR